jgi:hypothetical protein
MVRHTPQHIRGHPQRAQAKRQVDPEDQRPVDMLRQKSAEHRPAYGRCREYSADIPLVASALARRNNVGDNCLGERHQPAATEALKRARKHQRGHGRCQRTRNRTSHENDDRGEHDDTSTVNVRKFAVQWRHRRSGEKIGRHNPGQVLKIAEMPSDRRQRRCDNGLVEGPKKHREHDAEDDRPDLGVRQRAYFRLCVYFCWPRPDFRLC